jgi:hypothetical protein
VKPIDDAVLEQSIGTVEPTSGCPRRKPPAGGSGSM